MAALGSRLNWVSEMMETVLWTAMWLAILGGWLGLADARVRACRGVSPQEPGKPRTGTPAAVWHIAVPLLAIALAVPTIVSAQSWWWGSPVNPGFERSTVIRVSGTVRSVRFDARSGPATLELECPRDTYTVMLGPGWYLAQVGTDAREGDPLTVEGSKLMDPRGSLHLVAAWVKNERTGVLLTLRDDAGRPVWMNSPGAGRMVR